jgi:L-alanine-DL-glutamate epimerase-like enolase superfamily enzyme
MTDPGTSLGEPGSGPEDAPRVDRVEAAAFTVPLGSEESDGTLRWDSTTIVVVSVHAGDVVGTGYTYNSPATAVVVTTTLAGVVEGRDPLAIGAAWGAMAHAVRNQGRRGIASSAVSAVDVALWDLKARLLGLSLVDLLGGHHDHVPAYGSGGFTNLDDAALTDQLSAWAELGLPAVKMKVGTEPADDPRRVAVARGAVGDGVQVFVDANGAYRRKQALLLAERFADHDVRWLEEPVSSDDLSGLHLVRDRAPAGMDVTAGEYGWHLGHFRDLLAAGAVDCLQADVTRAGGITGVLRVAALADAEGLDLSAHCAPQVSAHALTAVWHRRHLEYFADHVRVESLAFDGVLTPDDGALRPDRGRPGHGLDVRWPDLEPYRVRTQGAA